MTKKKLSLESSFQQAEQAGGLEGLQKTGFVVQEEKMTEYIQVKLRPSEKDRFLSILEEKNPTKRKGYSASAEVRQLILDFIAKHND